MSVVMNQEQVVGMSHGCLEFCLVNFFHVLIKVEYAAILIIYFTSSSSITAVIRAQKLLVRVVFLAVQIYAIYCCS